MRSLIVLALALCLAQDLSADSGKRVAYRSRSGGSAMIDLVTLDDSKHNSETDSSSRAMLATTLKTKEQASEKDKTLYKKAYLSRSGGSQMSSYVQIKSKNID